MLRSIIKSLGGNLCCQSEPAEFVRPSHDLRKKGDGPEIFAEAQIIN